jgi:hypothetical protein
MNWQFEEKSGSRICKATSMPYGTYLFYFGGILFIFGILIVAIGSPSKPAIAFGVILAAMSFPVLGLSFFTKNPVTTIDVKERTLTVTCVYRFSEAQEIASLDDNPELKVCWYSNPILFTPGGPDGGKGIWQLQLVMADKPPIDLGTSQSREELEVAGKRMTEWLLGKVQRTEEQSSSVPMPSGEDIPKGQLAPAAGLAVLFIIAGMLCSGWGALQYYAAIGCSPEAVLSDLAKLESGEAPSNFHIKLGEHVAAYNQAMIYSKGLGEPTEDSRVQWVKYPILSRNNPFFSKIKPLIQKYKGVKNIPDNEYPDAETFSVLVLTRKWKTFGDIPDTMEKIESLEGLIINKVAPLTSDQKALIERSFPKVDADKLWIVEEGRRPYKLSTCYGLVGSGIFMLLLALIIGITSGKKES